jgi:hypothetical protein
MVDAECNYRAREPSRSADHAPTSGRHDVEDSRRRELKVIETPERVGTRKIGPVGTTGSPRMRDDADLQRRDDQIGCPVLAPIDAVEARLMGNTGAPSIRVILLEAGICAAMALVLMWRLS